MTTDTVTAVRDAVAAGAEEMVAGLVEWLRIPSVSGDPAHRDDVRRSAEHLAQALRDAGFPTVEVWETAGLPAVFAEWPSDDARCADGPGLRSPRRPAGRRRWTCGSTRRSSRPSTVTGCTRGARPTTRVRCWFHTLGVRAHLAATGRTSPAVNLKMVVEGEEESGSPNFAALLRQRADRLRCDVVVVSDTGMWSGETPTSASACAA